MATKLPKMVRYLHFYLLISDYAFNDHKAISQLERDSNKVSNKYCELDNRTLDVYNPYKGWSVYWKA